MRWKTMNFMVAGLLALLALLSPLLFAANLVLAGLPPLPVAISEGAWYPLSAYDRDDASFPHRRSQPHD
jgi:hypothetical protein